MMTKIDKNANLYDIDGNLISNAPLHNKTIKEVEELVDNLTKKVQENPDNEVYKVYLNNAQSFLFGMYNNMSQEDLMSRLSVLQNSIQSAKDKANEAESEHLDSANEALEQLKKSLERTELDKEVEQPVVETTPADVNSEQPADEMESISDEMDEYVEFEEV
jgi:hypothetical protein